ncbi:hypothetical protein F7725_027989 [Dissostichus mawsoni]|uniref:Uncharacterized protein n=1 Tax=Dissostichus mawsoni TaxID=36200 RepID=A0A7J5XER5_DISMA|nr:hypothetical protein F7725_027989 [Dissostichus mawsoni]
MQTVKKNLLLLFIFTSLLISTRFYLSGGEAHRVQGEQYLKQGQVVSGAQPLVELVHGAADGSVHRRVVTEDQNARLHLQCLRCQLTASCDSALPVHGSVGCQGVQLQENEHSVQPASEPHVYRPALQPTETAPPIDKTYSGVLTNEKLFAAADGQSFKCKSENLLLTSPELRIRLVPLQIQAFTLLKGHYGKGEWRWSVGLTLPRVIPIILGATVVGLFLIAVTTCLFIRDRHREGYDRL